MLVGISAVAVPVGGAAPCCFKYKFFDTFFLEIIIIFIIMF